MERTLKKWPLQKCFSVQLKNKNNKNIINVVFDLTRGTRGVCGFY